MPMYVWYALAAWLCVLAIGSGWLLIVTALRDRKARRLEEREMAALVEQVALNARKRESAKTLAWIAETDPAAMNMIVGDLDSWSDYRGQR